MKNIWTKSLLFSILALTSCGSSLFYGPKPTMSVNKMNVQLHTTTYVDGEKQMNICYAPMDTNENVKSVFPHILNSEAYLFKFNTAHEVTYFGFQYLDEDYNAIFPNEINASYNGCLKKYWFRNDDGCGKMFSDYTYKNDKLIIEHPTEDYKYILVRGDVGFRFCHEQKTFFYFVIEK